MAERTLAPTPRRLARARREGDIASARPLGELAALALGLLSIPAVAEVAAEVARTWLERAFRAPPRALEADAFALAVVGTSAPLMATVAAGIVVTTWIAQRGSWTIRPLGPRLERLNPTSGLAALWSWPSFFGGLRLCLAVAAASFAGAWVVAREAAGLAGTVGSLADGVRGGANLGLRLATTWLAVFGLLCLAEWIVLRGHWLGRMRMTREEVTRERREAHGDPHMRDARRRAHEALARKTALNALDRAALVVTDGHRGAVALAYDPSQDRAPWVLLAASGNNASALVRAAAIRAVPFVDDPRTARVLLALGEEARVPPELYDQVAELFGRI